MKLGGRMLLVLGGVAAWAALVAGLEPVIEPSTVTGLRSAPDPSSPMNQRPRRIVSLSLATDEILLTLLPPDHLLAITPLADLPSLSNVSDLAATVSERARGHDLEKLVALRGDLVLATFVTLPEWILAARSAGVPVVRLEAFDSIDAIAQQTIEIGRLVGELRKAEAWVDTMRTELDELAARTVSRGNRPRVLVYSDGFTEGGGTVVDELLAIAGGSNAAREAGLIGASPIGEELAIALDPEVIFVPDYGAAWGGPGETNADPAAWFRDRPSWSRVRAVRGGRVHSIPARHLTTLTPYLTRAARDMAAALDPDLSW